MNSKRFLGISVVLACLFVAASSQAVVTFSYGTGSWRVYDENGLPPASGATLLSPAEYSYSGAGCFVQLIYSSDGNIYPAGISGDGTTHANNVVIATTWIGRLIIGSGAGRFSGQSFTHSYPVGSSFFIRVWNAASSDYDGTATDTAALVPTGMGVYYGDSNIYATQANPDAPGGPTDAFVLTGDWATDLTPVPEPGTFALFGLGILTVALRRKFRK